jgi:penicillin-binding protein 1C
MAGRMIVAAALVSACVAGVWFCVPPRLFDTPYSTVLLDREGRLVGAGIAADEQWRFPPPDSLPARYRAAAVHFEDRRFRYHPGIDPLAVLRALWLNLRAGEVVSGASTITMQTIRLSRRNRPRTIGEKCIEACLALRLELHMSKDEILRLYAAHAPFGGNVVGLPAASWRYFGRDPSTLSWGESALLAVLPNSPSLIHPGRNRRALKAKRDRLLRSLRREGIIDTMTAALAAKEPLPPRPLPLPMSAPHLLFRMAGGETKNTAHLVSTLDKRLQKRAGAIVERHHRRLAGNGIHNAAALVVDIPENAVRAYVGNIADPDDERHGSQVDVISAPRSTGSILKPFLYAGMMQAGELLPEQLVPDLPTRLGGFAPQNYSKGFDGAVPAASALARSLNVPAVRLLHRFGVDRFHDLLSRLGMSTLHRDAHDYGLTLILGGAEGTLWDITAMYAGLARSVTSYGRGGDGVTAFAAPRLLENEGTRREEAAHAPLDAGSCFLTLQALLEVTRPNEERAWQSFASAKKIAWKTGTSYGFRDGWAVGVSPRHAVGVWVGNADGHGRPGLTGIAAAAPLLFDLFDLLPSGEWFDPPEMQVHQIEVCTHSGYRPGPHCATTTTTLAHRAGLTSPPCPYCRLVHCDTSGAWRVNGDCERVARMRSTRWFVLPPAIEWYYKKRHADYRILPPMRDDCGEGALAKGERSLSLIYPRRHARIYVPLELDGDRGRIVFEAAHRRERSSIFWYLDDTYLGETSTLHQLALTPTPGKHVLTLVDERGETVRSPFTVLSKGDTHGTNL